MKQPLLDPGGPLLTPGGTGLMGTPTGNGSTWADPGTPANCVSLVDGSEANAVQSAGSMAGIADGSGSR